MRHEPKLMATGKPQEYRGLEMRNLKCDECGLEGGESKIGQFGEPTRMCYGFDDDTGRPCRPLPVEPLPADDPVVIDTSVGGCSCGFRAATIAELEGHQLMHVMSPPVVNFNHFIFVNPTAATQSELRETIPNRTLQRSE